MPDGPDVAQAFSSVYGARGARLRRELRRRFRDLPCESPAERIGDEQHTSDVGHDCVMRRREVQRDWTNVAGFKNVFGDVMRACDATDMPNLCELTLSLAARVAHVADGYIKTKEIADRAVAATQDWADGVSVNTVNGEITGEGSKLAFDI